MGDGRRGGGAVRAAAGVGFPDQPGLGQRLHAVSADEPGEHPDHRLGPGDAAATEHLDVGGVIVVVEAEHLCMSMRGVRKPGARTITSAVRGQLRDATTRAEAMALLTGAAR